MFGRSGNGLRKVLSHRPSVTSVTASHSIHTSFATRHSFTPALAATPAPLSRTTRSTSSSPPKSGSGSSTKVGPASSASSPSQEQRRYQSAAPAAARQQLTSVNIASQFSDAFVPSRSSSAEAQAAEYPHHITLIKKVKKDGSPCRKCVEVLARIEREGFMHRIDRIVIADEANPMSEGMQMAQTFKVKTAPFFLVDSNVDKNEPTQLFTVYFKLKREILAKDLSEEQALKDIQESPQVQELVDFI